MSLAKTTLCRKCKDGVKDAIKHGACRLLTAERTSLRVALLTTLANCIYYNPALALAAMQQTGQRLLPIFTAWSEVTCL